MWFRGEDWENEEREALDVLRPDVAQLRHRHQNDVPSDVLKAARAGLLGDPLQFAARRYLSNDRWSQTLLAGLDEAEVSLTRTERVRLLKRIRVSGVASGTRRWLWPALATAAAAVIAIGLTLTRDVQDQATGRTAAADTNLKNATPRYRLALEKPEVRLSAAALTWRGSHESTDLARDLRQPFDAFRASDYATAEHELMALRRAYPSSVEVVFYLGVSRLYVNDPRGAVESLTRAATLADVAFASDVRWYRAIAQERIGELEAARADLTSLCAGSSRWRGPACAALRPTP